MFAVVWTLMSVAVTGFFTFGLLASVIVGELPLVVFPLVAIPVTVGVVAVRVGLSLWYSGVWADGDALVLQRFGTRRIPWTSVRGARLVRDPAQARTGTMLVIVTDTGDERVLCSSLVTEARAEEISRSVCAAKRAATE